MIQAPQNKSLAVKRRPYDGLAPFKIHRPIWLTMSDGTVYAPPCQFPSLRWRDEHEWALENVERQHHKEFLRAWRNADEDEGFDDDE